MSRQTQADNGKFHYSYKIVNNHVVRATVFDPVETMRTVSFDDAGYIVDDTRGGSAQDIHYDRDSSEDIVGISEKVTKKMTHQIGYQYYSNKNLHTATSSWIDSLLNYSLSTTTMTYEPVFNQLEAITDPNGNTTTLSYDPTTSSLSGVTDAMGRETGVALNAQGLPQQVTPPVTNPLTEPTILGYDGADLVTITTSNKVTRRFVDVAGRVVAITDPLGHRTEFAYDALDRVTSVKDPLGNTTTFSYDPDGNLAKVQAPSRDGQTAGRTVLYQYDTMGRLISRQEQIGTQTVTETNVYDAGGRLRRRTDRNNNHMAYSYDSVNRLKSVSGTGALRTFTYDGVNRLLSAKSRDGSITWTYHDVDLSVTEQTSQGAITYVYDAAGRRKSMADGTDTIGYFYWPDNQIMRIDGPDGSVNFTYDGGGRRSLVQLPTLISIAYGYDSMARLNSITYGTLGLTYQYDDAGRRIVVGGHMARMALPSDLTLTIGDADRISSTSSAAGTASYTFDSNGNLQTDGTNTYGWDIFNQLTKITAPGSAPTIFKYDALGRRISKQVDGGDQVQVLYDGANPIMESSSSSTTTLLTGLGIDEHLTRSDANGTGTFLPDAVGSTVALSNNSGVTNYTYEPFGAVPTDAANEFQFTGRENDGTGLYYFRARYYSPRLQRFISEDPMGIGGGDVNLYRYAFNDPMLTDPSGLFAWRSAEQGVVAGAASTALVVIGASAALGLGVPAVAVSGGLIVLGGVGMYSTAVSFFNDPSDENRSFIAGSLLGSGLVAARGAGFFACRLADATHPPPTNFWENWDPRRLPGLRWHWNSTEPVLEQIRNGLASGPDVITTTGLLSSAGTAIADQAAGQK